MSSYKGKCTIYKFGAFKIEELNESLPERIHEIKKFDLIVSRWTFRHLVDPLGTFVQTYNLLNPDGGILMADGFAFSVTRDPELSFNRMNFLMRNLLEETKAPFVIRRYNEWRSLNRFVVKRITSELLKLPLIYDSDYPLSEDLEKGLTKTSASNCATHFKWTKSVTDPEVWGIPWVWERVEKPLYYGSVYYGMKDLFLIGDPKLTLWFKDIFLNSAE